ncbi:hypothetical protein PMIN01_00809 [Paraphaeosphaeria minitans]|uniref:Uncharacterized protein n=1 Tax=Paraphaeosphaeria minitans TaxID=565426 RepID=A0A9P6GUA6_9PLEO|nr:hypothetical protein PMIN01_00809 [Paraphaeosphaeria minitans]
MRRLVLVLVPQAGRRCRTDNRGLALRFPVVAVTQTKPHRRAAAFLWLAVGSFKTQPWEIARRCRVPRDRSLRCRVQHVTKRTAYMLLARGSDPDRRVDTIFAMHIHHICPQEPTESMTMGRRYNLRNAHHRICPRERTESMTMGPLLVPSVAAFCSD